MPAASGSRSRSPLRGVLVVRRGRTRAAIIVDRLIGRSRQRNRRSVEQEANIDAVRPGPHRHRGVRRLDVVHAGAGNRSCCFSLVRAGVLGDHQCRSSEARPTPPAARTSPRWCARVIRSAKRWRRPIGSSASRADRNAVPGAADGSQSSLPLGRLLAPHQPDAARVSARQAPLVHLDFLSRLS